MRVEFLTSVIWIPHNTLSAQCLIIRDSPGPPLPRGSIGNLSTHARRERENGSRLLGDACCPPTVNGRRKKEVAGGGRERREQGGATDLETGEAERNGKKSIVEATKQSSRARVGLSREFALLLSSSPRSGPRSDWRVSLTKTPKRAKRMKASRSGRARSSKKDRDSRAVRVRECDCLARARTLLKNNEHEYI